MLGSGVLFLTSGMLVSDGVFVSDGVLVSDGVFVSDASMTSNSITQAFMATINGDPAGTTNVQVDTGLDCLSY